MKSQAKPPRKKSPPPGRDEDPNSRRKGRPAAPERQDQASPAAPPEKTSPEPPDTPSREEIISNVAQPVTNSDEQEKITNADQGDIPVAHN